MHASAAPRRSFPRAAVLLFALAITTGWVDGSAGFDRRDASAARIAAAPLAFADSSVEATPPGVSFVIHHQERAPELVVGPREKPEPAKAPKAQKSKAEKPDKTAKRDKASKPARSNSPPIYAGENRFWIPSLGISNRVHLFECSRQRPPDHYMYRWGCAGVNNTYIMGHASSVMAPLHRAYVRDRLRVGMVAIYANGNGKLTRYRVTEWRVVDPVDLHWAIADQPVPSMTLQTCVGKDGRLRLNVRLVAVD